jgi:mannose-6-phosphate isomerase-like protein (cupin superfamily)
MKAEIRPLDTDSEYYFEEGCFIIEMANSANDPDVSIARARVDPGKSTRWHQLGNTTERYVIIEGQGQVEIGKELKKEVRPGDVVIIPPDQRQRISNTGTTSLIFLAICSPRFNESVYSDVELTS